MDALPKGVPLPISRLIRRCLAKDPRQRLRDIGDARLELHEALSDPIGSQTTPVSRARGRVPALALAAASIAGGAIVAGIVVWNLSGAQSSELLESASVRVHRLTDARGLEEFPALSPDGRSVAFVASAGGNLQIFVRLTAGGNALQLTRDAADHVYPRWSPDSASILYYSPALDGNSPGAIWEIPALGGPARRIASSLGGGRPSGGRPGRPRRESRHWPGRRDALLPNSTAGRHRRIRRRNPCRQARKRAVPPARTHSGHAHCALAGVSAGDLAGWPLARVGSARRGRHEPVGRLHVDRTTASAHRLRAAADVHHAPRLVVIRRTVHLRGGRAG
ncbi:MAG: PD40 domain-containing protein [Acidobacteria bacterium]|nr:PD40 domain-containing protein [Acidobacteriota bacterium]